MDELTKIALDTVNSHIDQIRETVPLDQVGEAIRQLAYTSVIFNDGTNSQASIIANYIRTLF